ncbi:pilus assembly protein TadE [Cellulomonas fimi]|uniref:TadE family protein n=1 Tax=Cellulomonas fimi (strain ATCC 484 / DSM 20113 / JCM 1341 / CCUG 24087 / LMG 16345 / NBRC 15513 / NCIMB 8980 / NCTC 7547 / NRS-133) TaxID=590998 RepID=F4H612_CELFA|nr:pilus assembly protein TadE [Cellulomonas fimi]AEE46742.1 TadE family protein [Cellulomonas fimi ATCC 484]VEH34051.1 Uncharacterised protein [Cellulomonas fimi]
MTTDRPQALRRASRASTAVRRAVDGLRARLATAGGPDDGNAVLEFLGVALVLLVPTVYLVLVLGRLQAATFAVEGAAREAARTAVSADDPAQASRRAAAAAGIALRDQGFDDDPSSALTLSCSSSPCLAPGSTVAAHVEVVVPLPFVPTFVRDVVPLEVPVSADRVAPVDTYRARP